MHTTVKTSNQYVRATTTGVSPGSRTTMSIRFPEEGKLRSRKVVTRSKARPTGKYPSFKMKRMIQWESTNELRVYRILDASPFVKQFREQPAEIRFWMDGVEHKHYPDTLVIFDRSKEFWEIKCRRDALAPETVARTALLMRELPHHGYRYRMVIAEDLAREPRQSNIVTILYYGRQEVALVERERIRRVFASVDTITWGDVLSGMLGKTGRNHICRLILEGELFLDVDEPLCSKSVLRAGRGTCNLQGWEA